MLAHVHWLDIIVLLVYLGIVVFVGVWLALFRNKTTESYFLGDRNFPGWAIGISMVGTGISSMTFLAYPGDAFKTAWLRMLPNLVMPIAVLVAAFVFLPFFRRNNITSAFEYLEARFGPSTRLYGAIAYMLNQVIRLSLILYLLAILLHELTGMDPVTCAIVAGIFVSFYTIAGGMEAVVWTDVIQTIVLVVGGGAILVKICYELPGGLGTIFTEAMAGNKFALAEFDAATQTPTETKWGLSLNEKTVTMMLMIGLSNYLMEYSSNQHVVQRYCAARSMREARKALLINVLSCLPIWAYFMFLGTALWVFFNHFPAEHPNNIMRGIGDAKAEQILPYFVVHFMPAGLTGLVLAAILAAAMSSLDSCINSMTTVTIVDVYRRHLVKNASDQHYLLVARLFGIVLAVLMICGAIVLIKGETKTLQHSATILQALTSGGMLGLFMLGFFSKRADGRAMAVAIVCTLLFTIYRVCETMAGFPDAWRLGIDDYYTGIFGHIIMFAVGYGVGLILPAKERDLRNLTIYTQDKEAIE